MNINKLKMLLVKTSSIIVNSWRAFMQNESLIGPIQQR